MSLYMNYLSILRFFINLKNMTYSYSIYMTLQWSLLINLYQFSFFGALTDLSVLYN